MKQFLSILFGALICITGFSQQATDKTSPNGNAYSTFIPTYTDADISARLKQLSNEIVPPRFDRTVRSYVNTYTVRKRLHTERMLGQMDVFFPLFEQYLEENKLPLDLKYLPVVESALNPNAVSRSGAVGLWQFMPATGKEYGLRINSLVDERKDPNKATQAAIKYLGRLYRKYRSWPLALAAYNGGPGRVNRAIKRGRSKNFWRIRRYLPVETRNYVPAFVAAYYIVHYYQAHNLLPQYPEVEMQLTASAKLYERISFQRISEITGTPMYMIEALNPSYKQRFIPSSTKGNYVILPQHRLAALLNHLGRPDESLNLLVSQQVFGPRHIAMNENFRKLMYIAHGDESLELLADRFNCSIDNIKEWNNMRSPRLWRGQRLVFFVPKVSGVDLFPVPLPERPNYAKPRQAPSYNQLFAPHQLQQLKSKQVISAKDSKEASSYLYYQLRRRETLSDIANRYDNVSLKQLLKWNKIKRGQRIPAGTVIKIKRPE